MKKIAILGHFGGNEEFLDGQTVKTKILYSELRNKTDWDIQRIDTFWKSKRPIRLLMQTIFVLLKKEDVIVLLSGNGMKFFFPLLFFFVNIRKVRVFHDVIGGNLHKYVQRNPKFMDYLNSFEVNWVETETLKQALIKCGVNNCEVMPNFKRLNIVSRNEILEKNCEPYRFCTFSRVMEEKGIEDAINAIESINADIGRKICMLDIYGVVEESYREHFEKVINDSSDAVHYCGVVPYDKSVSALKEYYALLFPTHWDGEGFPGTIIDAFSAGIPVIASDWNSNREIVQNGVNGIIYPSSKASSLKDAILNIVDMKDEHINMRARCLHSAREYEPEIYVNRIIAKIDKTFNEKEN